MLTEYFIASSLNPPSFVSGAAPTHLRDATIFLHQNRPTPRLVTAFKKSSTSPNSLALSSSHFFAAQHGKSTLHIYSRSTNLHEATIPFPERLHSNAITPSSAVLILGTESGGIFLWETLTGRLITLPPAHLQAVNHIVVDPSESFFLTGASDSTVLVWSLHDILGFSHPATASHGLLDAHRSPRYNLTSHGGPITSLAVAHATGVSGTNMAASASTDKSIILWAYETGVHLKTILLQSAPQCLAFDTADRAIYAGFEDGSISCVPFYSSSDTYNPVLDTKQAATPISPPASSLWRHPAEAADPVLSMALNYEGTMVYTGHQSGKISTWSVGDRKYARDIADYAGAPITNIHFISPEGFRNKGQPSWKAGQLVKPRVGRVELNETYNFKGEFPASLEDKNKRASFSKEILSQGFSADFLDHNLGEFFASLGQRSGGTAADGEADFMALDGATQGSSMDTEVARLKAQVASLTKQTDVAKQHISRLLEERVALEDEREAKLARERASRKVRDETTGDGRGPTGAPSYAEVEMADGENGAASSFTSSDGEDVDINTQ